MHGISYFKVIEKFFHHGTILFVEILELSEQSYYVALIRVEEILRAGGVAIVPTDTVYGIIADATNDEAVKKIFSLKRRPLEKSLPIFVKDIQSARWFAYISDIKAQFLERIWPCNITIVFHHKEKLPSVLTGGADTIALRIPNHKFLLQLLTTFDRPIVQSSANIAGFPPAKNIEELRAYFGSCDFELDLVVDAGVIQGTASTVLDFTRSDLRVVRTGLITKEELDRILGAL